MVEIFKHIHQVKKIRLRISNLWFSLLMILPDEYSKYRVAYYNKKGCKIHKKTDIATNVRISGKFEMGSGSSLAQNCIVSGLSAGVFIAENVMVAPNVVIVAFNHNFQDIVIPMALQGNDESAVHIESNVWIAANCTIGMGVRIGHGSIIAANSFVNKDIPAYSIAGGVPAKIIKSRI
jgi:acetyltransferase-like isoleucine patch superfamily enzyme